MHLGLTSPSSFDSLGRLRIVILDNFVYGSILIFRFVCEMLLHYCMEGGCNYVRICGLTHMHLLVFDFMCKTIYVNYVH